LEVISSHDVHLNDLNGEEHDLHQKANDHHRSRKSLICGEEGNQVGKEEAKSIEHQEPVHTLVGFLPLHVYQLHDGLSLYKLLVLGYLIDHIC
jgi:hypothetical protein